MNRTVVEKQISVPNIKEGGKDILLNILSRSLKKGKPNPYIVCSFALPRNEYNMPLYEAGRNYSCKYVILFDKTKGKKSKRRFREVGCRIQYLRPTNRTFLMELYTLVAGNPNRFDEESFKKFETEAQNLIKGKYPFSFYDSPECDEIEKGLKLFFKDFFNKIVNNPFLNPTRYARKHKRIPRQLLRK